VFNINRKKEFWLNQLLLVQNRINPGIFVRLERLETIPFSKINLISHRYTMLHVAKLKKEKKTSYISIKDSEEPYIYAHQLLL
jgi:hypothetical protein